MLESNENQNLSPGEYLHFDPRISPLEEVRWYRFRQKVTFLAMAAAAGVIVCVGPSVLQDAIDMISSLADK